MTYIPWTDRLVRGLRIKTNIENRNRRFRVSRVSDGRNTALPLRARGSNGRGCLFSALLGYEACISSRNFPATRLHGEDTVRVVSVACRSSACTTSAMYLEEKALTFVIPTMYGRSSMNWVAIIREPDCPKPLNCTRKLEFLDRISLYIEFCKSAFITKIIVQKADPSSNKNRKNRLSR